MKAVTSEEMQRIDKITIEEMGIPGEVLMAYAGRSVSEYILNDILSEGKVSVFSGTGNNGGDGFVIAYLMFNKGFPVEIYIAGDMKKVSKTSRIYLDACINLNIPVKEISDKKDLEDINLDDTDLIIDAMLGTGFRGPVRGIIGDVIKYLNRYSKKILSVDMPSGLPSDGDSPEGDVIAAEYTATIGLPKISLVTYPGTVYCGKLKVMNIGFPEKLLNSEDIRTMLVDREFVKKIFFIPRDSDSHKGSAGHLLLIGGFDNMEGSILLAVKAAFETGIGLATLLTTEKARKIIAGIVPELITGPLPGGIDMFPGMPVEDKISSKGSADFYNNEIKDYFDNFFRTGKRYRALVIGPGMGRSIYSYLIFKHLMENMEAYNITRVLIDGDGLYHLSVYLKGKKIDKRLQVVLTPHFAEASLLSGKSIEEIKKNRLRSARELSGKTSAVVVLKGPSTVIAYNDEALINTTGNPCLATAGSGDVLSGIIGGLLLKTISAVEAAGAGVFIHGSAADLFITETNNKYLKASRIIEKIGNVVSSL